MAVAATGREVIGAVADKLGTAEELLLVHFSSAGGGMKLLSGCTVLGCKSVAINLTKGLFKKTSFFKQMNMEERTSAIIVLFLEQVPRVSLLVLSLT